MGVKCCRESKSPDNEIFKELSLTYAQAHPLMKTGDACKDDNFNQGITNGAFWYEVRGMSLVTLYVLLLSLLTCILTLVYRRNAGF